MTKRLWEGLNPMRVIVLVFVLFWTLELPSLAAQESDSSPLGTGTTLFADWNRGDLRAMSKLFVQRPSVTDVFPRFYWRGEKVARNRRSDLVYFSITHYPSGNDFYAP